MAELFPDETVLPYDYPIYGGYFYLADGKVYRSGSANYLTLRLGSPPSRTRTLRSSDAYT